MGIITVGLLFRKFDNHASSVQRLPVTSLKTIANLLVSKLIN